MNCTTITIDTSESDLSDAQLIIAKDFRFYCKQQSSLPPPPPKIFKRKVLSREVSAKLKPDSQASTPKNCDCIKTSCDVLTTSIFHEAYSCLETVTDEEG